MAFIHEYKCGCIQHQLAGLIRKCEGTTNRSLTGRMASKPDNSEKRHNDAMERGETVRTYEVANILP